MVLEVIVDISTAEVDRPFDYLGDDIPLGSRVLVPFGMKNNRKIGFVIGKKDSSSYDNLKQSEYIDSPINDEQLKLMEIMRKKYNLRYIDVLRLFIPSKLRDERDPEQKQIFLALTKNISIEEILDKTKRALKQHEAVNYLAERDGEFLTLMNARFGASAVKSLRLKGFLEESNVHEVRVPLKTLKSHNKAVTLTQAQENAADAICKQSGTYLLHGVTGSGKTEVYLNVITRMLEKDKTAIMLVPEISLTPQMLGVFRGRFDDKVAVIHSGLNASERYDEWKRLKKGEARIALGARSAIFAPLENIGVIIIDEEHDASYVSESNPRYDTKEIALMRAEAQSSSLVLGSATPSMETYLNAMEGRFSLLQLPDRVSSHKLPEMEIIDMTQEFRSGNSSLFSYALSDAIKATLDRKEQVMLFLNRRGFSSFLMCRECGYIAKCENCDVSLTYHKTENELKCHCCGKRYRSLSVCPNCKSEHIRQGRTGTEKVVEELQSIFPEAKILRMDKDTTSRKDSHFRLLNDFAAGKSDILVGTQMIAKGHDFPNVTLVGILEADSALYFSDYRSSERTFQLVTQVAGRAGRADKKGRVILQTYSPRHYVFVFARNYDYEGFWKKEINARKVTKFPPFTKLVRVLVAAPLEEEVVNSIRKVYKGIKEIENEVGKFVYLGASKSPVTRMNGLTRYQILMRLTPEMYDKIMPRIFEMANQNVPAEGTCFAEINPQNFI